MKAVNDAEVTDEVANFTTTIIIVIFIIIIIIQVRGDVLSYKRTFVQNNRFLHCEVETSWQKQIY